MKSPLRIVALIVAFLVLSGGLYINSRRTEILEKALTRAEEIATQKLGVPVKIGDVDFNGVKLIDFDRTSDLIVRDVEIFDKHDELIARVDEAKIDFKVIALTDDPVAALEEIHINGATLNLTQRDDDSWNFNDIKVESEGESTFGAKIFLDGGTVNADFGGKKISVAEISGQADCADMNAIATTITAKTLGATVKASGTIGKIQQLINAEVDTINFDKVLPYLPADKIPDSVEILGGTAHDTTIHLLRRDEALTFTGTTKVSGASVKVEQTDVRDINGTVTFSDREIILDASASANGQYAAASGTVRLDTDETFFDIHGESDSFAPSAIIADIGIDGAAAVKAHLLGTATNPQVDAEIFSDSLGYENLYARNVSTKLRYAGEMIYLSDTSAQIFGGNITGTVGVKTSDRSFNANVKARGLDAATLCEYSGSEKIIDGKISADLGINSDGISPMKVYGNAQATALEFEGLHVNDANASFYFSDDGLTIDYLSAKLPNRGTLGLEGTITDTSKLDLNFYGAHVDLTIAKRFNDALDMSGLADFKGTVRGDSDNPNIKLELSAVDNSKREGSHFVGKFFKQPFDSIQLAVSGSLDGVQIDKFNLDKDGKLKWTVIEGNVGLTGEKNVDIELDTTEVRAEDIAALVAPDQEITGNVTNTVKITGTIDNPQVAGNIKFNRGSYRGILLSGMTGEYFLEGDVLRLQDFEITSPMVDMVLNGTINKNTQVMDFVVQGKDIRLERFKAKLPENYQAQGHTMFEGIIKGTPDFPIFDGELTAQEILLNGVTLTNVYGHLALKGSDLQLEDFHFNDGKGTYQLQMGMNLDSEAINGSVDVTGADIANLLTLADKNTELITGTLDSKILASGTLQKPTGTLTGEIVKGKFAGYDIHDIKISVALLNNVIRVNQLEGKQGDNGTINLRGTADLFGALDMTLSAHEIELGLFSSAAGYNVDMVGTSNIDAKIGGTVDNPAGDLTLKATGGIRGSTFDLMRGHFTLNDWRVNVEEFIVQREISGKTYGASANGFVPLRALTAGSKEQLPDNEQLNLTVSLDGADLSLLPVMSKHIAWGIGALNGSVKITGTAAHPQINGAISLNDGSVKVKDMKTLIEHINIATVFKGERFDVETFSGNIGGGTFNLTGGFSFGGLELSNYNFDFAADNLKIDSAIYDGLFNATFNLSEQSFAHWKLPKLSGQIDLDRCQITVPSLSDDDEPLPNVLLDVSINFGNKVHFYSSRLYDMYLTGNAQFKGSTLHPKTSGTVTVKRGGTLTYLESVFNIREGEAYFNQLDTFLPTLHFMAETKIDRTKIFLAINGSPNNMKFTLTSSPEMTETEIMRLLTLREAYSNGGGNLTTTDALAIGLQMTILSDIEDALKRSLGIDQLRVSRGSGSILDSHNTEEASKHDDKDYNVTIGKYINDKLMIRYTRGFGSHKLNRYGLQYDFNDNLGFTIEREGKDYVFTIEARYKF